MRITTTGGEDYYIADMCACCRMTTGGEHEAHCPLYGQPTMWNFGIPTLQLIRAKSFKELEMAQGYQDMAVENAKLAEESMPATLEVWPKINYG